MSGVLAAVSHWPHQLSLVKPMSSCLPSFPRSPSPSPGDLVAANGLRAHREFSGAFPLVCLAGGGPSGCLVSADSEWASLEELQLGATSGPPANQTHSPSLPVLKEMRYSLINDDCFFLSSCLKLPSTSCHPSGWLSEIPSFLVFGFL